MSENFKAIVPQSSSTVTGPTIVAGINLGYQNAGPSTDIQLSTEIAKPGGEATTVAAASHHSAPPVNAYAQELARISAEKGGKDRPVCFNLSMGDRTRRKLLQSLPSHVKVIPIASTTAELLRNQCALIQSQLDAEALAIELHGGQEILQALQKPFQAHELALIREAFYDLDTRGTGRVDREKFEDVLRAAKRHEEEISGTNKLVRNADENGDGCLDWVEFLMLANRTLKSSEDEGVGESEKHSSKLPSSGEFDFATSYSARLLSIFRLKPKHSIHPLMVGSDVREEKQNQDSRSALDDAVASEPGSQDWWKAIDSVVEELAYPPPLKDLLPPEADGKIVDRSVNNDSFPALSTKNTKNLALQRAQRNLTAASEHRLGRLMLRALLTQLRDSGTTSSSLSPRKGVTNDNDLEDGLPSAVMAALLKVEHISIPKGASMPLFDHGGTEYGELAESGPPQLSAAFKFHGGNAAVREAEQKRSANLRLSCEQYPYKVLQARCAKANNLRGEPKKGEKLFSPGNTIFDDRGAATIRVATSHENLTGTFKLPQKDEPIDSSDRKQEELDDTDPIFDFGTYGPSVYDHVVAKEVHHGLGGGVWEGRPTDDTQHHEDIDSGEDDAEVLEERARAHAKEQESASAHKFVSKGGKRSSGPLFLHLGGAGVQVGEALWEEFGAEANAISTRGTMDVTGMPSKSQEYMGGENPHGGAFDSFDPLFTHVGTGGGGFIPRALFADIEPDACHRLQHYSACRSWISPEQVVTFNRESNGVFPKGYSKAESWKLRNAIRVMLEHMDSACDGFVVTYAPSGASGSSLASNIARYLGDECQRSESLAFALGVENRNLATCNGPFGIYNSVVGLANTTADDRPGFTSTITISNEAVYNHPDWPADNPGRSCFGQCNSMIAGAIAASMGAIRSPSRCSNRDSPLISIPDITNYLRAKLPGMSGGSLPYSSCIWSKPGLIGAVPKSALGGTGSALHGIPSPRPKLWTPIRPLKERFASISSGHLFTDVGVCRCLLAISGFVAPYARPDLGGLPSEQPWFDVGSEANFITGRVLMPVDSIQPKALNQMRPEDDSDSVSPFL